MVDQIFKDEKLSKSLKKIFIPTYEISETQKSTPTPKNVNATLKS